MTDVLRVLYKKARREGSTARNALAYARYVTAPLPFPDLEMSDKWSECAYRESGKFTGLTVRVKIVPDDSADTSWLGEFTDSPTGAIKRPNAERGQYRYVKPATTEEEHYRALRKLHYGKATAHELAREYVMRDVARLERWASGEEPFLGVLVECRKKGTELASASLWGIDDSAPFDYTRRDVIPDLIAETVAEARAKLAELCDCKEEATA